MPIIKGTVVEYWSGRPISGALIFVVNASKRFRTQTTTDVLGRFTILVPRSGVYTISVFKEGFEPFIKTYNILYGIEVTIRLKPIVRIYM